MTLITLRGKFTRICMEVDLRHSLVSKIHLKGELSLIIYEGLKVIYFHYKKYNHHKEVYTDILMGEHSITPLVENIESREVTKKS